VKILRMQGAKDPDEFLKKYGADRFRVLLDRSENQAEYRLLTLRNRFNLEVDEERVEFLKQAAELVATFRSAVEREVYGTRAAEAAGITPEAMKLEVNKAYRRRMARERKRQEQENLNVAAQQQPKEKGIRYDNLRSAMAEEEILRQLLKEPDHLEDLKLLPQQFSCEVLGKAYSLLRQHHAQGRPVQLSSLEGELTPEEMKHLSMVARKRDQLVSDRALLDCAAIVREEYERSVRTGDDALLAMQARMKEKKGYGG